MIVLLEYNKHAIGVELPNGCLLSIFKQHIHTHSIGGTAAAPIPPKTIANHVTISQMGSKTVTLTWEMPS